jgi:hypothetical protein
MTRVIPIRWLAGAVAAVLWGCGGGGGGGSSQTESQPSPPAAIHFAVVTPSSAVAGVPITVTVTALDASNNPVTAYTGTVTFSSSDPLVVRPADTHLTSGTASVSATLNTAGSETITATDTMTASITGRSNATEVFPAGSTDTPTGTMGTARNWHTATLLHDGTVLITGGCSDGGGSLASAEVFHPATGTFTPTANDMSTSRCSHTATLLNNQQVLVTGGGGTSADLYDPSTGRFSPTGNMGISRSAPTATLLKDGTVLITGGQGSGGYLASAEVFDPGTGLFTPTAGNMTTVRWGHTATLMADSRVLVTGGIGTWAVGGGYLQSAEIYDAASRTFTATGSMHYKRWWHTATLLGDGNVLVVGGEDVFRTVTASAELFNPANGVFMAAAGIANGGRRSHTATLLTDGRVLITGGEWFNSTGGIPSLASAGLYDLSGTTFTPTSNMFTPRSEHTATRLNDGSVLVTGGIDWTSQARTVLASAELYY